MLNPYTMLVLADAVGEDPRHIVDICFLTRKSTTTIYKAWSLGYLEREAPATFWATDKLMEEVKQFGSVQALRVADMHPPRR